VNKNLNMAVECYKQAAEQGDDMEQDNNSME